jgi:hypothetical protein
MYNTAIPLRKLRQVAQPPANSSGNQVIMLFRKVESTEIFQHFGQNCNQPFDGFGTGREKMVPEILRTDLLPEPRAQ